METDRLPRENPPEGEDRRRIRDLFEGRSRRFAPEDVRRVGFTRFTRRSLTATVDACLRHCSRTATGVTRVLDLGCGTGGFLPLLREHFPGAMIHGVDLVEANVAAAVDRGYDAGDCFDVVSVGKRMAPDSMDLVMSVEVIQYLSAEDRTEFFAGIGKVLRPGGSVVLVYPNLESWVRRLLPPDPEHFPFPYTTGELSGLAAAAGFLPELYFGGELFTAARMTGRTMSSRLRNLAFRLGAVFRETDP